MPLAFVYTIGQNCWWAAKKKKKVRRRNITFHTCSVGKSCKLGKLLDSLGCMWNHMGRRHPAWTVQRLLVGMANTISGAIFWKYVALFNVLSTNNKKCENWWFCLCFVDEYTLKDVASQIHVTHVNDNHLHEGRTCFHHWVLHLVS